MIACDLQGTVIVDVLKGISLQIYSKCYGYSINWSSKWKCTFWTGWISSCKIDSTSFKTNLWFQIWLLDTNRSESLGVSIPRQDNRDPLGSIIHSNIFGVLQILFKGGNVCFAHIFLLAFAMLSRLAAMLSLSVRSSWFWMSDFCQVWPLTQFFMFAYYNRGSS